MRNTLVVSETAFEVAVSVLSVKELHTIVGSRFGRLSLNFEELVRLDIRNIGDL
jgi:hypothetical protein